MKKPIQDLIDEHGGIMVMLTIIEKMSEKLHRGEAVDNGHLNKVVEFLKNFADKCHHGKEEGILFPELLKNSLNAKLVNELLGEHKSGRDYIRGISESLEGYSPGNPDAIHIAVNIDGYTKLLTEHIRKENVVLFPVADVELVEPVQEELAKRFDDLERNVIGEGKHEEYHGWLEELKSIYLD